jgi:hypothetical protein
MTSRRLTARGAATRDRIVAAAADLMYVKGVNATTLDDTDEQARVSLAGLSTPGKGCWRPACGACRTRAR